MRGLFLFLGAAIVTYATLGNMSHLTHAYDLSTVTIGNATSLPLTSGVTASSLPTTAPDLKVSAADAINVAETTFNLTDSAVDQSIGVIPAVMSIRTDPLHQDEDSWVVTFDTPSRPTGPGTQGYEYEKLCVVVDASTGQYLWAYPADLQPTNN